MCSYHLTPRIETDRLILRQPRPEDATAIARLLGDYDVVKMLSRVPWPYTLDHAQDYVAKVDTLDAMFDQPLSIEHREHGLIGGAGFHTSVDSLFPEIGYWIGRDYWGQGYATEATLASLGWARSHWGKRAIASSHFVDNPASARVLQKADFLYTGDVVERRCEARGEAAAARMMIWLA